MKTAKEAIQQFSELMDAISQNEYIYCGNQDETIRETITTVLEFVYEDEFMDAVFNRLKELSND